MSALAEAGQAVGLACAALVLGEATFAHWETMDDQDRQLLVAEIARYRRALCRGLEQAS